MSKVAELLQATKLNEVKMSPSRLVRVEVGCTPEMILGGDRLQGFNIIATFGAKCFVDLGHRQELQDRIDAMRRAVIYEVFGEFIPPIHALYLAIFERDFDAAKDQLQALERQIFSIPPGSAAP